MANKMTNRKALAFVLENVNDLPDDVREKLENMAAALENKATSAKPTAKQLENAGLRESIMEFFQANPNLLVTCTDLGKKVPELVGLNNQRISALVKPLSDSGKVTKIVEKGKSLFQLAKSEDEGE